MTRRRQKRRMLESFTLVFKEGSSRVVCLVLSAEKYGRWISKAAFTALLSHFVPPENLHLRVQQRTFCKRTPPERISTSCFSRSWGSRRGVRLRNIQFSPVLSFSTLRTKKNKKTPSNSQEQDFQFTCRLLNTQLKSHILIKLWKGSITKTLLERTSN